MGARMEAAYRHTSYNKDFAGHPREYPRYRVHRIFWACLVGRNFAANVVLFCLIREASNEKAFERVKKCLVDAGLWKERFGARIKALRGDLAKPQFGLLEVDYEEITKSVSDIYHSGAWVNMTIPYSGLSPSNVGGTLSVIRMACERGARVHYVSSANVLTDHDIQEDWLMISPQQLTYKSGYAQTKVVCERLLHSASQTLGLEVRVYRVSSISGHTRTRFFNPQDWINLLMRACAKAGGVVIDTNTRLHWVPVDFVARAVVTASRTHASAGSVFNIIGDGPTLSDVFTAMQSSLSLREYTRSEWEKHLKESIKDEKDDLFSVVEQLLQYPLKHKQQ